MHASVACDLAQEHAPAPQHARVCQKCNKQEDHTYCTPSSSCPLGRTHGAHMTAQHALLHTTLTQPFHNFHNCTHALFMLCFDAITLEVAADAVHMHAMQGPCLHPQCMLPKGSSLQSFPLVPQRSHASYPMPVSLLALLSCLALLGPPLVCVPPLCQHSTRPVADLHH